MKKYIVLATIVLTVLACKNETSTTVEENNTNNEVVEIDPLPSWNDGETKEAIIDFIELTTTEGSEGFIPVKDRIATFDNDGNLWAEQPMYFQLFYAIDEIKRMAPEHPEWQNEQPFKAILEGDVQTALAGGEHAILE